MNKSLPLCLLRNLMHKTLILVSTLLTHLLYNLHQRLTYLHNSLSSHYLQLAYYTMYYLLESVYRKQVILFVPTTIFISFFDYQNSQEKNSRHKEYDLLTVHELWSVG